jgi:dTDP-4-amino-4,6-dideoxygalactose transaminase
MTAIGEIAAEHGLSVIEDCAHSPGARHKEQFCGTLGDVGCFSFYANKNLTTGEGGMLVTNSDNLAASARLLRSHGMTSLAHNRHSDKTAGYDVQALGYNYAIDEIRSALGLVQLKKLDNANNLRRQARKSYCEFLSGIPGLSVPFSEAEYGAVPHIMSVILPLSIDRTKVIEHMHNAGIQTSIHYPAIHKFSYYQKSAPNGNPGLELSEEAEGRLLTLPLYPELAVTEIKTVCQTFASAVELYAAI